MMEPMPFWQWKEQQYAKDQAARTPHEKEWYCRAYGGYCAKVRRELDAASGADQPKEK